MIFLLLLFFITFNIPHWYVYKRQSHQSMIDHCLALKDRAPCLYFAALVVLEEIASMNYKVKRSEGEYVVLFCSDQLPPKSDASFVCRTAHARLLRVNHIEPQRDRWGTIPNFSEQPMDAKFRP
jgi:hypothetical protein